MTAIMGPYEASLRERAIATRKRLFSGVPLTSVRPLSEPGDEPGELVFLEEPPLPKIDRQILTPLSFASEEGNPFRWRKIVDEVLQKHRVTMGQICGLQRRKEIVAARFEAYFRLSEETTLSLPKIGSLLGGKDHTSVLHGIRTHRARLEASK